MLIQITLYRRCCQVFYQATSKSLTAIFIDVKTGLQKYHDTWFSRSGVYQMWILNKTAKDLMETLSSRPQYVYSSMKTFILYILKTTIPPTLLRPRIKEFDSALLFKEEWRTNVSVYLLETSLTLPKAIQNLIINITRTRSFILFLSIIELSCLQWLLRNRNC